MALAALALVVTTAVLPTATSARTGKARTAKPSIKGEEVGYFGNATVTSHVSVFVYSATQPRNGTHVTVCVQGRCRRAQGHKAKVAWYSASFPHTPLRMGDPVTFSVAITNSAGRARTTVTQDLLCMHNDGSTPQTS